jgi:ubiquinone/menaquinone biosynthesis C-methylase UbiE
MRNRICVDGKDYLVPFTDVSISSVKKLYHDNYWETAGVDVEYPVVSRVVLGLNPCSVLEVGCGNGHNIFSLLRIDPGVVCTGVDVSSVGIEKAREFNSCDFFVRDARDLPFCDDSVDVVFTVHALEQMKYCLEKALGEIYRVCKRFVVLFEPFFVQQNIFGKWHIIRSEYAQGIPFFVEDVGFRIVCFVRLGRRDYISRGWNRTGLLIGEKLRG